MTPTYQAETMVSPLIKSGRSDFMVALGGAAASGHQLWARSCRRSGGGERLGMLSSRRFVVGYMDAEQHVPGFCCAGDQVCSEHESGRHPVRWP